MSGEHVELEGIVEDEYAGGNFRVKMKTDAGDKYITASLSGRMRNNKIRVIVGDTVKVRFSPYDLERGQIYFRGTGR